jgi:hypothetical protein
MGYGLVNGFIDHSYTPLGTTLYKSQTSVLSLLESLLAVSWQQLVPREILSVPHSGPLVTDSCAEPLSNDDPTNWVPGWWPFHTNLLVFSSQAGFELTTDN